MGSTHPRDVPNLLLVPEIICGPEPAPILCAATTSDRAQAINGVHAIKSSRAINPWITLSSVRLRSGLECEASFHKGTSTITKMIDAIHEGKLKSMYVIWRRNQRGGFQRELRRRRVEKTRFLVIQDIFFKATVANSQTSFTGVTESREGRHFHKQPSGASSGCIRCLSRSKAAAPIGSS